MPTTALVFIGHTKERIIESILRPFSIDKIILVVGEQESTGEVKAREIAFELTMDFKTFFDVETTRIDKKDVMRAAQQITGIIRREQASGSDVLLNMSASLRTFSIAAYIAGCITQSKMFTAIPKYDENDHEIGIEDIIELPILPLNTLKGEQLRIITALKGNRIEPLNIYSNLSYPSISNNSELIAEVGLLPSRKKKAAKASETKRGHGGVASLDELVFKLNPKNPKIKKGTADFASERSRLSHHLKNFESMGLVTKKKAGKNVGVRLTGLGEMFV
jgi:CRISPR-associated protein Csa3